MLKFTIIVVTHILVTFFQYGDCQFSNEEPTCYNATKPRFCRPTFTNAAYKRKVNATNTCGINSREQYCFQNGAYRKSECEFCDNSDPDMRHPSSYLTDFNSAHEKTWWQSESLNVYSERKRSAPSIFPVNLTIDLGTQFELTYIKIKFQTPRPFAMALYKKFNDSSPWQPLQYFSGACNRTFPEVKSTIEKDNDVICEEKYSSIIPLFGGEVHFAFLENRPGKDTFFENKDIQKWVLARSIRIELLRLNTFGDEIFENPKVFKTYFYAINDISIGGRCNCNGHAASCTKSTGPGVENGELYCACEHNTAGQNCEKCKPEYQDRPWEGGTLEDPKICQPCKCHGNSRSCLFDNDLYINNGKISGGRCINCKNNTEGNNCEKCKQGFKRVGKTYVCEPCNCDQEGSINGTCDAFGQCPCKPGAHGERCDKIKEGYYGISVAEIRSCGCTAIGTVNNAGICNNSTGNCDCKDYVEGQMCNSCLPGYFGLSKNNPNGCQACFCFGHSSRCSPAPNWYKYTISPPLTVKNVKINGDRYPRYEAKYYPDESRRFKLPSFVSPKLNNDSPIENTIFYYHLPGDFLGDRRSSYNQYLTLKLSFDQVPVRPDIQDISLVFGTHEITISLTAQNNPQPVKNKVLVYRYLLNKHVKYGWNPKNKRISFWMGSLRNLTGIKIRSTYDNRFFGDQTYRARLHAASLEAARFEANSTSTAVQTVEQCKCPQGHTGQFCELCEKGYQRGIVNGGPFSRCIPCECSKNTDKCDAETGQCHCLNNTTGLKCDQCVTGYYGNTSSGMADACKKCPCPDSGPCMEYEELNKTVCLKCPKGHSGLQCEKCKDGYFGNPPTTKCQPCNCSDNIDINAIGSCDPKTGTCLRCIGNTTGARCQNCKPGFYGNATSRPGGDCKPCLCHKTGSVSLLKCSDSGICACRFNVIGDKCDSCRPGFYNLTTGYGCISCRCDPLGTRTKWPNTTELMDCSPDTGKCVCKPGVIGITCDRCAEGHYNLTADGCMPCECNRNGTVGGSTTCDVKTGQCSCKSNTEGRRCDKCPRNRHQFKKGCVDCPICYSRIKKQVEEAEERWKLVMTAGNPNFTRVLIQRLRELKTKADRLNAGFSNASLNGRTDDETAIDISIENLLKELNTSVESLKSRNQIEMMINTTLAECASEEILNEITNFSATFRNVETTLKSNSSDIIEYARETFPSNESNPEMTQLANDSRRLYKEQDEKIKEVESQLKELRTMLQRIQNDTADIPNIATETEKEIGLAESIFKSIQINVTLFEETANITDRLYADVRSLIRGTESVPDANRLREVMEAEIKQITEEAERLLLRIQQIYQNRAGDDMNQTMIEGENLYEKATNFFSNKTRELENLRNKARSLYNDVLLLKNRTAELNITLEGDPNDQPFVESQFNETMKRKADIQQNLTTSLEAFEEINKLLPNESSIVQSSQVDKILQDIQNLNESMNIDRNSADALNETAEENEKNASHQKSRIEGIDLEKLTEDLYKLNMQKKEASTFSSKSSMYIEQTLANLTKIEKDLNEFNNTIVNLPDMEILDALAKRIDDVMLVVKNKTIDNMIDRLQKEAFEMNSTALTIEKEYSVLEKERDRLQAIAENMPGAKWKDRSDTCFRNTKVET